jgi:RHS repeat-associated protein
VINLANLNAHWTIPIVNKPGRGTTFTYNLNYDSSIWEPATSGSTSVWLPAGANWGWGGQVASFGGAMANTYQIHNGGQCGYPNPQQVTVENWNNWVYTDSSGTQHAFGGGTTRLTIPCNNPPVEIINMTGVPASDGSGYELNASLSYGTVTFPNGTIPTGTSSTDNNGNQITFNTTTGIYTDTLGQNALTIAGGVPPNPSTFTYTAPNGKPAAYTMNYTRYTVATNFGVSGITEYGKTAVWLVSSIVLPDNTQYTFAYEPTPSTPAPGACTPLNGTYSTNCVTARLTSVQLPTGGSIVYSYTGGNNGILADGSVATLNRTITPGGAWVYAHSENGTAWTTTVTDPQNNQTALNFQGIYETERQAYQGSVASGTLLKTTTTCYNGSAVPCNSTVITLPISKRAVILKWPGSSGLQSQTVTNYNSYGLPIETDEYAYGTGAPGSIVRKTLTSYASLGNGIVDKPASVTVEDGSNNVKAQTTYTYDQGSITATSGTPQQAGVTGSRGNLTTISYLVQGSTTLSQTLTYFDTGNVQTATDMNTAQTTFTYGACGNSFPTLISEPLNLSKSMTWNCTGGVETSVTDENGNTASTGYTKDAYFWRPDSTTDQTSYVTNLAYTGQTSVESSLQFNNENSTTDALSTLDGLGQSHVLQTREGPSSSTYDSVETDYDSLGRPDRTTLPYAGTAGQANPSAPATATSYDALSRPIQVTDSGNGIVTFSYAQNDAYQTTKPAPTGENTKQRQYEYDALGRLTSVCEITSGTSSWPGGACAQANPVTGYWTQYTYDFLNNLTGVSQNAQSSSQQTRSYTYDDLGRITAETNPESGTTTYVYDTDATCGTYHGDLVKKVDQVGNTTCFAYDALHRITSVTYPSGSYASATPNKYFVYDSATVNGVAMTNAKARLAEAYTCLSSCPPKLTDEGFSYTARGETADVYQMTPHSSPSYYHVSQTYWPHGAPYQLSSNITGLPTISYGGTIGSTVGLDGEGRVTQVTASSGQNPVTGVNYNPYGTPPQTTVTYGSSDSDVFSFDPNTNRMTKYQFNVNSSPTIVGNLAWNPNSTLQQLAITDQFNSADNQTCNYLYDDLARLASANCGTLWGQSFTYDPFGNIAKSVLPGSNGTAFQAIYSTNLTNHITEVGNSPASYDSNGNVTNDTLHQYAWDADANSVTIDSVGLTYDALDRMVERNSNSTYTEIVYSPAGAKLALMSGQSLQKAFVALPGGGTAVYTGSGLDHYRHSDWLGSSRFASTSTRTVLYDGAYAPFGEAYAQSGTPDLSFTGQNQDTVANLYDFPVREYNGIQGRWPSPDPAGIGAASPTNPQSWNRYAYSLNDPIDYMDPSGADPCNLYDDGVPCDSDFENEGSGGAYSGIRIIGPPDPPNWSFSGPSYPEGGICGAEYSMQVNLGPGQILCMQGSTQGVLWSKVPYDDTASGFKWIHQDVIVKYLLISKLGPLLGDSGGSSNDNSGVVSTGAVQYQAYLGIRLLKALACVPGQALEVGGDQVANVTDWDPTALTAPIGKWATRVKHAGTIHNMLTGCPSLLQ